MERRVLTTTEDLGYLQDFDTSCLAVDTETTSLRWYDQELIGVSLCDGKKTCYVPFSAQVKDPLRMLICSSRVLVMHNATFDAKALYRAGINVEYSEWFDPMIAHHLIDENKSHGLKSLAKEYLSKEPVSYEEAIKKGVNSKEFYEYAMNDAEWAWELAQIFKKLLAEQDLTKLFRDVEMPFLKVLAKMEMRGVKVDLERVNRVRLELAEQAMNIQVKMLETLGEQYELQYKLDGGMSIKSKVNFNSTAQLERIFTKLGLEITEKTETGRASIGRETISRLKNAHPFVGLLHKYKIAQKLLTAFFNPLPELVDKDGRVRPHYNDAGTVTGRLSCRDPNLQQLPKVNKELPVNTRSCFVATPGKKMVSVDYSQQELRIAAHLCQDPTFISIIANGGDLHLANANTVFNLGIPHEALFEKHTDYEKYKSQYKKERDKGKVFSFGILYGMGAHKLSRDFHVGLPEAEGMLRNYFSGYPELEKAIKQTHADAENDLYVTTLAGRRRHFEKNEKGKLEFRALRQSFNFLIQSFGADIIRRACIRLQDYADKHPQFGIDILMTVHDEIVLECNADWAPFVARQAENILEGCASLVVPLKAEANLADDYGACK